MKKLLKSTNIITYSNPITLDEFMLVFIYMCFAELRGTERKRKIDWKWKYVSNQQSSALNTGALDRSATLTGGLNFVSKSYTIMAYPVWIIQ